MNKHLQPIGLFLLLLCFTLNSVAQIETLNLKPRANSDDAEQTLSNGFIELNSSDLELGGKDETTRQIVGIRFPNVTIPVGATITNAYIQFSVDETENLGANITIKAQQGNAATYTTATNNITNRNYTPSSVVWNTPAWNVVGERGANQRTPDLSGIITEALQSGFTSGNALGFTFSVSNVLGEMTAEAFDTGINTAPELVIEYTESPIERKALTDIFVINEVTGTGTLENSNDWVELYNKSNEVINLDSVFVTDDFDEPAKFMFSQKNINGGAFVLLETADYFGIKDEGETVYLFQTFNGNTVLLDSLVGRPTALKTSYGRKPDGSSTIIDFNVSTPGSSNNSAQEFIDLQFSRPRGIYTSGFSLSITAPAGTTIRYTTNSTTPSRTSGIIYNGPIQINRNTVIKTFAYANNGTSRVVTNTYLISSNLALQEVPIVSVSTTNSLASQSENDCTVEYIDKYGEGSSAYADAGFRVFGAASVNFDKKNYRFFFRKEYGYSKFDYPMFEKKDDENYSPVKSFNSFDIRSSHDAVNIGGTNMSTNIAHNYLRQMGNVDVHTKHVHVFMNGSYHGVYTLKEHYSAAYAADYFGGDKTEYDRLDGTEVTTWWDDDPPVSDGSITQWNELKSFATSNFQEIKARLEIKHFIDFMLIHFLGGFEWEYRAIAHRGFERTKFRFHHNDFDGFIRDSPTGFSDYLEKLNTSSGEGPGKLFYLAGFGGSNLEYRTMVKDRILTLFNENSPEGVMTVSNFTNKTNEFRTAYRKYNQLEYDRWNYTNANEFEQRVNGYINYLPTRFQTVRNFLNGKGLVHTHDYVSFSQPAGKISSTIPVTITNPNPGTQVYYAIGGDDVVFDNAPSGTLYTAGTALPLKEGENIVKARAYSNGNFGPLTEVTYFVLPTLNITGINYNPLVEDTQIEEDFEFLLVTNSSPLNRTVAGDSIKGISFVFPAGAVINGGETVMIAKSADVYPSLNYRRILWADGKLSNKGEKLTIKKANQQIINLLEYDDKAPWPVEADGDGYFLKLKQVNLDNTIATNWEALPLPPTGDPCVGATATIDSDGDGVCDLGDICDGFDDNLIGTPCDDGDDCTIGETYDTNCGCSGGTLADDIDNDAVCDAQDLCPGFDDTLLGQPCNDGDPFTESDIYTVETCGCAGSLTDTDKDGTPDIDDLDDDNDGLLDSEEGFCFTTIQSGSWTINGANATYDFGNGVFANVTTSDPGGLSSGNFNASGSGFWSENLEGNVSLQGVFDFGSMITITFVDASGTPIQVTNPIIHFDRVGGATYDFGTQNSALIYLLDGYTWTHLGGGTTDFEVTPTTVQDGGAGAFASSHYGESTLTDANGSAAGSVEINGTVSTINLWLDQNGPSGAGADGIEFILSTCKNLDTDGDGIANHLDSDSDNDSFLDREDTCLGFDNNLVGQTCDDGNPLTNFDIYTADACGCDGTFDVDNDNDGVPTSLDCNDNDANLTIVGATCDDGNANTANDVVQANCTCAGTLIDADNDGVPASLDCNDNDANLTTVGATCDDGNPDTANDVVQANCSCAGTLIDADNDGFTVDVDCNDNDANLTIVGATCNDGNVDTENDVVQANCSCAGTLIDADNDGFTIDVDCNDNDANLTIVGATCNDRNADTENDVVQANCSCAGTLIDADNDGVPVNLDCDDIDANLTIVGATCDDGDATTENDVVQADCSCVGEKNNVDLFPNLTFSSPTYQAADKKTIIVNINEILGGTTDGSPIQVFVPFAAGFTYTFDPTQTTATVFAPETVNNPDWSVTNTGTGFLFSTNTIIASGGRSRIAIEISASSAATKSSFTANLVPNSGGEMDTKNNIAVLAQSIQN